MLELLANILVEGVLTLLSEVVNFGMRKSLRAPSDTSPLDDAFVGAALGFVLGLTSVYFFPTLALREPVVQWLNAVLSPLAAGVIILFWRSRGKLDCGNSLTSSRRLIVFQAFVVGLFFNLSRLMFGH